MNDVINEMDNEHNITMISPNKNSAIFVNS